MNSRNDFSNNGEFTTSTNFLIRVPTKAFAFILISTLLTILIVTIHAPDALSLDTSFSDDGMVTTSFSAGDDVGSGIAVQFDDKIVVVGTSGNGSGSSEFAVARFNIDGSLDPTFNGDGVVNTGFSAGDDVGSGIAVQSDDKIVVVGTRDNGSGSSEFAVARFNIDGSLDPTFDVDGKVTVNFSGGNDVGSGVAVQSDEKIVVVGTRDNGSGSSEFAVARFNVDGSLDPTFDVDGKVTVSFSGGNDVGSGVAVQSDDKIVVVGTRDNGSGSSEFAVARFNVDGSLDNSFSGDGKVTTSFTAGYDVGSGIAVLSDGKIAVVGTSDDLSTTWFAVARYNVDGSLDSSFLFDGTVITKFSFTGDDMGSGIAIQSDDKIVVVGSANDERGALKFAVARFNADGSFASNANSTGKVSVSFSPGDDVGSGIAIQSDDKIVVVGISDDGSGSSDLGVARYLPDLAVNQDDDGGGDGGGGGGG
ncbi:hypothetical protein D1AOALGA4SA_12199 [Olavius algarvensis Delta 1 endosymbiont]|nr:hypothetical protein D1AOALGA4SA_12199 [Olavius algarvensis Delta 1 endosymbiont]